VVKNDSKPAPYPPSAPARLAGLWRREGIVFPDGRTDRTTQVFWGQTHSLYVDLRIPLDRLEALGRRSFDEFTLNELCGLADQKGFAGHVVVEGDVCNWVRYMDYQPDNGRPDRGYLSFEGEVLYEEGDPTSVLGTSYKETYHRERKADRLSIALRHNTASEDATEERIYRAGVLVVIDDRFLFAVPRKVELPPAETLRELVVAAGDDRELIGSYLDCEVSFGSVDGGAAWKITSSTIPFREGERIMPRGSVRASTELGCLEFEVVGGAQIWHIVESTLTQRETIELLNR